MTDFRRILVANRGEIALRVFRAARELGIGCVAVYSEADRERAPRPPRRRRVPARPGRAVRLLPRTSDRVFEAAHKAGADAIHPGYGFLAENAVVRRAAARRQGIVWIGPPPEAIEAMGSKIRAREIMLAAGVPIVPGTDRARSTTRPA